MNQRKLYCASLVHEACEGNKATFREAEQELHMDYNDDEDSLELGELLYLYHDLSITCGSVKENRLHELADKWFIEEVIQFELR